MVDDTHGRRWSMVLMVESRRWHSWSKMVDGAHGRKSSMALMVENGRWFSWLKVDDTVEIVEDLHGQSSMIHINDSR
jgi:hypothetical protein